MTKEEAIELFFKHHFMARQTLKRLMCYEKGMSLREYSNVTKKTIGNSFVFLSKHGIHSSAKEANLKRQKEHQEKLALKWNPDFTVSQNARLLKISYGTALNLVNSLGLEVRHHTEKSATITRRLNRIVELKKKGVLDTEIGRMFNLTRERVRQYVHDAKVLGLFETSDNDSGNNKENK